ncbi:unnamed protein product [Caenorhabditis angaria]|uniref:Uncharacterized protein n=1 Tax=Caenorhabditis angaria TaxID=860376 RepID=A0A9P1MT17_9PELO|nr:unnamed protein product [Caenorhabditis angaria]
MKFVFGVVLVAFAVVTFTYAAPSPLEEKLRALQEQLNTIEKETETQQIGQAQSILGFQPQKRMVAWQPMKRSFDDSRQPLVHAIEARLAEVLRAGERLGVNPEEVLADLRARNQFQ